MSAKGRKLYRAWFPVPSIFLSLFSVVPCTSLLKNFKKNSSSRSPRVNITLCSIVGAEWGAVDIYIQNKPGVVVLWPSNTSDSTSSHCAVLTRNCVFNLCYTVTLTLNTVSKMAKSEPPWQKTECSHKYDDPSLVVPSSQQEDNHSGHVIFIVFEMFLQKVMSRFKGGC